MRHSPRERAPDSNKQLFWGVGGLILCVTLYATKPCSFLQPRRSFLNVSYSKMDTNNNYPWRIGISVHITTLLLCWTKVLDLMLFHGSLPLTKPGFTAVDAFVTQYYTKLVLLLITDGLMCTAYTNLANTFPISISSKNSDLSSMLEA